MYHVYSLMIIAAITFQKTESAVIDAKAFIEEAKKGLGWAKCVEFEMSWNTYAKVSTMDRRIVSKHRFKFRLDNQRFESMGDVEFYTMASGSKRIESQKRDYYDVCNGEYGLSFAYDPNQPAKAYVSRSCRDWLETELDGPGLRELLLREPGLEHKSMVDLLLTEGWDVGVDQTEEVINGVSCCVIHGMTKHGKITLWIAPTKGYIPMKWEWELGPDGILGGKRASEQWPEFRRRVKRSECSQLTEVRQDSAQVYYIPRRFVVTDDVWLADGTMDGFIEEFEITSVVLRPDFSKLRAFEPQIPDGTRVIVEEEPGIRYIWRGGKIVPDPNMMPTFDEIDRYFQEANDKVW